MCPVAVRFFAGDRVAPVYPSGLAPLCIARARPACFLLGFVIPRWVFGRELLAARGGFSGVGVGSLVSVGGEGDVVSGSQFCFHCSQSALSVLVGFEEDETRRSLSVAASL